MKGLVLAGGKGSRLRPMTWSGPKQLIPVANRPILFHVLDSLATAGLREVGIVVAPDTGPEIRRAVGDGARWGLAITWIPQEEPLGLAHAVAISEAFVGTDDVCVYLGDNLVGSPLAPFLANFARDPSLAASVLLKEVEDPTRFGVAEVDDRGRVVRLVEKPAVPASNLALVGIYLLRPAVFAAIRTLRPSARGELEITDALMALVHAGLPVRFERLDAWWLDTGKKDDLLLANDVVLTTMLAPGVAGRVVDSALTGPVRVEEGAEIVRSTVEGPAVVGAGARVVDAHVGRCTSVGAGAVIERARVERCVLLEDCRVADVRLVDSLVGRRVDVRAGAGEAVSLLVGDDCRVEVPRG